MTPLILVIFLTTIVCTLYAHRSMLKRKVTNGLKIAPSVPALPFVGSLAFMAGTKDLHLYFSEKAKQYGDVFSFKAGSVYTVVLNSHQSIDEALNKSEFATRREVYFEKLLRNVNRQGVIFKDYNESYKRNHKIIISILKEFGYGTFNTVESIVQTELIELIKFIKEKKGASFEPLKILNYFTLNVINHFMFAERYGSLEDADSSFLLEMHGDLLATRNLVFDLMPITRYLPKFRKLKENMKSAGDKFVEFYTRKIQESLKMKSKENFVQKFVERIGDMYDETDLIFTLRDLFLAGSHTTASSIAFALIQIGNNKDIQTRMQEELDTVIGRDRLPSLDDRQNLPYVDAVILEVLRIRPALSFSVRCTNQDTEVCGFHIPKDTFIFANIYGAHRDPNHFKDHEVFRPERFLDSNGQLGNNKDLIISFGRGKRSCLGEQLARQELFLVISTLVQQFNILPPEGESSIIDKPTMTTVLVPSPFSLRFVERFE